MDPNNSTTKRSSNYNLSPQNQWIVDGDEGDNVMTKRRKEEVDPFSRPLITMRNEEQDRPESSDLCLPPYFSEESEGEHSETDDFIPNDNGPPVSDQQRRYTPNFSNATLQEAQDIFGLDFDYVDEYYDEEEDPYEDGEGTCGSLDNKQPRKKKCKSIFELNSAEFTDQDDIIRNQDMPERMQLRSVPVTTATKKEMEEEAEWIFNKSFSKRKGADESEVALKSRCIPKIYNTLDFMRNDNFEAPFIHFYRKEYVRPELASINDLWEIYRQDAKFCELRARKLRLLELFKNIKEYQMDCICQNPDDNLSPSLRLVSEHDFERVRSIKTSEELKDMYSQFTLYYSDDIIPMKALLRKRKEEKERREREAKKSAAHINSEENDGDDDEAQKVPGAEQTQVKGKIGTSSYSLCKRMGLEPFTKIFGLSPRQFAENVQINYQHHPVEQHHVGPLEAAQEYILPHRLPTADEVLKAAKYMVATQLSREPILRQKVRQVFFDRATINVHPTKKGMKAIGENHPVYPMKYLKDKPVEKFEKDEFLTLATAEADGLITLEIGECILAFSNGPSFIDDCKKLYIFPEFSAQAWNIVRSDCVEMALTKILFPIVRNELRAKLLDEAKEFVLRECSEKLQDWIAPAPYTAKFTQEAEEEDDESDGIKVVALSYVPDLSQPSFACFISPDGQPSDYLRLQNIAKVTKSPEESVRLGKEADLFTLKNLMRQRQPHVVVIGGESMDALMIQESIRGIAQDLKQDENLPHIDVEIVDNQLAKIYANSAKANSEFPDHPTVLRQAISLGRLIQEPLIEFSQLCSPDEELLRLNFHKLQDQVPKDELLERLYLEFVNMVNQVGVDINQVIFNPRTQNFLQFVSGLGNLKATALIKALKDSGQRLDNRIELVTVYHMGTKIFMNCSGFIKIDTNSLDDSDNTESYVNVLDSSRIHPQFYGWAEKMAVDALEYDEDDANPAEAVAEILRAPDKLKDLDLDAFADELQRQGFGSRRNILYDIRHEFYDPYKDYRESYAPPKPAALFRMLTKETLFLGKLIVGQTVGIWYKKPDQVDNARSFIFLYLLKKETGPFQCPFCQKFYSGYQQVFSHFDPDNKSSASCPGHHPIGVKLKLYNGICGFILFSKLSDQQVTNQQINEIMGQEIQCRVIDIDVNKFQVECTSRRSDILDANNNYGPKRDDYYDYGREEADKRKEQDELKPQLKQTYTKRLIVHPMFRNVSFRESEKLMEQMGQGDAVIRPSSRGIDCLNVTWKVTDGIYQHIHVREEGKENSMSLGQKLWIGKEVFESLDDIIVGRVRPMAALCRDVINNLCYSDEFGGDRKKAEGWLFEEKKKDGKSKMHIAVYACREYPGKFVISYLPRAKVVHEFVTVTPQGFRFRHHHFEFIHHVIMWLKEHYEDPSSTVYAKRDMPRTPGIYESEDEPSPPSAGRPSSRAEELRRFVSSWATIKNPKVIPHST